MDEGLTSLAVCEVARYFKWAKWLIPRDYGILGNSKREPLQHWVNVWLYWDDHKRFLLSTKLLVFYFCSVFTQVGHAGHEHKTTYHQSDLSHHFIKVMSNDVSCLLTFEKLEMLADHSSIIIRHNGMIWSNGKRNLAQGWCLCCWSRTLFGGHLLRWTRIWGGHQKQSSFERNSSPKGTAL